MSARPEILLIHGACHGSWCWRHLTPLLERSGFNVDTIDLPGRDPSPAWGWRLRLKDQAAAVVAKATALNGPIIALAHSMGGLSMSMAAELEPKLFRRLIYLTAYLPSDGDRLITLGGRDTSSQVGEATRMDPFAGFLSIKPGEAASTFYDDCADETIDWAKGLLVKEPLRPSLDRLRLTERFDSVPRSYIRCTRDRVVTLPFQDEMIAARPCEKLISLESSHSPFLSMPDRLASAIAKVA